MSKEINCFDCGDSGYMYDEEFGEWPCHCTIDDSTALKEGETLFSSGAWYDVVRTGLGGLELVLVTDSKRLADLAWQMVIEEMKNADDIALNREVM